MNDAELAALFLLAIGTKRDEVGVELREIILAGDFYERTILEHGEVEAAVRFLIARGLITTDEDRFATTPAGRELIEGLPRSYDSASRRLAATLQGLPEQQPTEAWGIEPTKAEQAVDAYVEMWRSQTEN